ncbi:hypothetical protein P153DRAFT_412686 [Dothidotthia symphoricarpi CBS 119687]|uniref:Uncharacterized protein n=1 Tax=Dothidotthia symphoricarpi CBS 119687 TaxID=1392245 RepID=A0A6A5ZXM4_9PLEO|nr:uncharacterized protein P153DRAFT_412686 [Dothidotthia symphoricarpi CBS 119687]KAF2123653.1 hypothetical protein P153DRAFT_412686 [Dothidotthia symphoricarpi CBS 119687]
MQAPQLSTRPNTGRSRSHTTVALGGAHAIAHPLQDTQQSTITHSPPPAFEMTTESSPLELFRFEAQLLMLANGEQLPASPPSPLSPTGALQILRQEALTVLSAESGRMTTVTIPFVGIKSSKQSLLMSIIDYSHDLILDLKLLELSKARLSEEKKALQEDRVKFAEERSQFVMDRARLIEDNENMAKRISLLTLRAEVMKGMRLCVHLEKMEEEERTLVGDMNVDE